MGAWFDDPSPGSRSRCAWPASRAPDQPTPHDDTMLETRMNKRCPTIGHGLVGCALAGVVLLPGRHASAQANPNAEQIQVTADRPDVPNRRLVRAERAQPRRRRADQHHRRRNPQEGRGPDRRLQRRGRADPERAGHQPGRSGTAAGFRRKHTRAAIHRVQRPVRRHPDPGLPVQPVAAAGRLLLLARLRQHHRQPRPRSGLVDRLGHVRRLRGARLAQAFRDPGPRDLRHLRQFRHQAVRRRGAVRRRPRPRGCPGAARPHARGKPRRVDRRVHRAAQRVPQGDEADRLRHGGDAGGQPRQRRPTAPRSPASTRSGATTRSTPTRPRKPSTATTATTTPPTSSTWPSPPTSAPAGPSTTASTPPPTTSATGTGWIRAAPRPTCPARST